MELKFNIAIVGSGFSGNITSLALAKAGYRIALIDPKSFESIQEKNYDTRTTALSKKSKKLLQQLNLWQAIKPFTCMIKNIMVVKFTQKRVIMLNQFEIQLLLNLI